MLYFCVCICFKTIGRFSNSNCYLFLVRFRRRRLRRRSANTCQLSGKTPEANLFKPHMVDLWMREIFLAPISVTLGQGHWATGAERNLPCPRGKVRTAHPIAAKLGRYVPLIMLSTWLNFGEILPNFFSNFFRKILDPFSPVEPSIFHILGMVGPFDVKQKGNDSTACYAD